DAPGPEPRRERERMLGRPRELAARERLVGRTSGELLSAKEADVARVATALVRVVGRDPDALPESPADRDLVAADRGGRHVLGADEALRVLHEQDQVVDRVV